MCTGKICNLRCWPSLTTNLDRWIWSDKEATMKWQGSHNEVIWRYCIILHQLPLSGATCYQLDLRTRACWLISPLLVSLWQESSEGVLEESAPDTRPEESQRVTFALRIPKIMMQTLAKPWEVVTVLRGIRKDLRNSKSDANARFICVGSRFLVPDSGDWKARKAPNQIQLV